MLTIKVTNAQLPWLHVDGKWIKDSQGNVMNLHGVNFEGYEWSKFDAIRFNHKEEDYQKISEWGFNVVRLPIAWHHIEPTEGYYNESYFTNFVDRDIQWAKEFGIYILLDFQKFGWSPYFTNVQPYGNGLPIWMVSGYPNSQQGLNQLIDDFWLGKAPNGTVATTENPSMQDRMITVWKYIANRYKGETSILGYDLFNEPSQGTFGIDTSADYLYPFYERLIDGIKTVDANHIFVYEPLSGRWDYGPRLLNRSNTIFSAHVYPGYNDATKGEYSGDITILNNQLLGYLNLPASNPSKDWNIPILMGEFGPSSSPLYGNDILWVNDMADVLNEYGISWIYWNYGLSSGNVYSIVNPDRTEVTDKADALDKAYPRLSSIPPTEFSFDRDTKLFEVVFNGVGDVETEVYVPSRYYPSSFSVNCNSSQWTKSWDEQNRTLTVNASLNSTIQITINLGPSQGKALIVGKVTNSKTGAAVTGATVTANGYEATTGAGGTYSLEVALGNYNIAISATGYEGKTQTLNASEEKTYTVDIALVPLPSVDSGQGIPRNAIIIGGAVIVVVAVATVAVLARRRRRAL